jgi:hypothetical protein
MTAWTGVPEVNPSAEVATIWSAPCRMPASRSRPARLAPSHLALPMYGPPTGLDTQHSVIQSSISGRLSRSRKLIRISFWTIPWIRRCQADGGTWGRTSASSTR